MDDPADICNEARVIYARIMLHLANLATAVANALQGDTQVPANLQALQAEVAENRAVMESAVVLLSGLKTRLDEALNSPDLQLAINDLAAELDHNTAALAAAVVANTVAEGDPADPASDGETAAETPNDPAE